MTQAHTRLFRLRGKVQNYAWGGSHFLPELLGLTVEPGRPYAEYWMGAHASAPSMLETQEGLTRLDEAIAASPEALLGPTVARRFGRLPFLFKVLDVRDMLSIQVHPTKEEAERGFAEENAAGIPLSAPHRNYKDDNHKPELMVALSDFWLLHGFLPEEALTRVLQREPELAELLPVFRAGGYRGLYQHVMELPQQEVERLLRPLVERVLPRYRAGELTREEPGFWAARAVLSPDLSKGGRLDRGIFSIYFFNIVRVAPGQAVFQDAGVPHAYLEGQNMELMANSDNVLRGGLTPKHVDVPQLLKHVTFRPVAATLLEGERVGGGPERVYRAPVPDFLLSRVELEPGQTWETQAASAEVLIVTEGAVQLEGSDSLALPRGQTAVAFAGERYRVTASKPAVLYKAGANL